MQINGVNEFFSRIASLNGSADVRGNSFSPTLIPQGKAAHDSLLLSDVGKKLSLNVNKAPLLNEKQKIDISDPLLRRVDKSMAQVEDILEEMHKLATAAQDKKLTDLERVDMQIEFEELRKALTAVPMIMLSQSGGPAIRRLRENDVAYEAILRTDTFSLAGNGTNLLDRMRNRIKNGQEWNVREAFAPDTFDREVYNDEGHVEAVEVVAGGEWHVVDDKNILTTRERLELSTPVVLMDAKSAADGAERIEQQINDVQKWRDRIAEYSVARSKGDAAGPSSTEVLYSAYAYLSKHPLKGDGIGGLFPRYYLHKDGVTDDPFYFTGRSIEIDVSGSITLELESGAEKIKNNAAVTTGPLYYRNNILTEVEIGVIKPTGLIS